MGQGRGSARPALAIGLAILCLMAIAQPTLGAIYSINWTFNVVNWPRGKSFRAGDVLVFNYARSLHNVVPVSGNGYKSCNGRGGRVSQSGRDRFTLRRGANYFICSFPGHCQGGMKIAVNAA
ncbi:basic blue protein-like [Silene latifolia]|uniref:basic blue protein-like n=1 Tax=Silene latifolia TaxID=37657 RepID=UPI003D76EAA7